ncbi:MAG TPA: trypsin-like peptidase domain-containing protein [Candidatus Nanopelagicales bacterium]|nr:trypsin-like peptidase domain-containing protein [Candidatus Nanopelagicales bacterium]
MDTATRTPDSPYAAPFEPFTAPEAPAPAPQKDHRASRTMAAVAATALLAGGVGGAVGATLAARADNPAASTASSAPIVVGSSAGTDIEAVSAKVLPSVVQIAFSGQAGSGTGSGVVLSKDGIILTNNHVVAEAADGGSLTVTFHDGRTASATIVGRDPGADIAVIRVDGVSDLVPVQLGSSSDLKVGQQVVAIGSPLGLSGTVTSGIVSALNRPVVSGDASGASQSVLNAIQTDAAVNPGNSGGALVDAQGRLVGINSAIATLGASQGSQSGSIGLGFAIPIDQAKRIADELVKSGTASRAVLGVQSQDAQGGGAQLSTVADGSGAAQAGLKVGDVVTSLGGVRIADSQSLLATVRSQVPNSKVDVTYVRDGRTSTVSVTLGSATDQT